MPTRQEARHGVDANDRAAIEGKGRKRGDEEDVYGVLLPRVDRPASWYSR
jgi:hypothetical protein